VADLTPEALAQELHGEASRLDILSSTPESLADKPHWSRIRGRVASLRYSAAQVRKLAPAHAALTAELDAARAENARYRGALEDIEARGLGDGTDARTARQALEGGR
jgi:hypothetical protein